MRRAILLALLGCGVACGCTTDAGGSGPADGGEGQGGPDTGTTPDAGAETGSDASSGDDGGQKKDAGAVADVSAPDASGAPSYATNFDGTENPISEGGRWTTGKKVGLDWQDPQTAGGLAFSDATVTGYTDPIAHLSGYPANQSAKGTVHRQAGYTPPSSHEIELLLRFAIAPHKARGYEIDIFFGSGGSIVRWNGALGDFTVLNSTGPGVGDVLDGDVLEATAIGDVITVTKNGTIVMKATDATWSDGNPGFGLFVRPGAGAVLDAYCWTSYAATSL
jgi:hypothetical protein